MSRRAAVSSSRRLFLQGAASAGVLGTIGTGTAAAGEAKADLARRLSGVGPHNHFPTSSGPQRSPLPPSGSLRCLAQALSGKVI